MTENTTDNDAFINAYLKKQEEFAVEVIRNNLELKVKLQFLQGALIEKDSECKRLAVEKSNSEQLFQQSIQGLEAVTVERDELKRSVDKLKEENASSILSLRKEYDEKLHAMRNTNINIQNELAQCRNALQDLEVCRRDYDTLKQNYDIISKSLQEREPVKETKPKKQSKKLSNDSEWVS